jgi:general secretion pathway protein M
VGRVGNAGTSTWQRGSMTTSLPTGRRGQLLASALTLVVVASVWVGVVTPLLGWHAEQTQRMEQRRALARRMAELVETLPALQAQAAGRDATGPAPSAVLAGETDAVAGAALQLLVQQMATGAGTSLSSVEVVPAEAVGGYRRIGLHVALAAPWPVLVHLLQSLEQATPPMLVDDLRLHGSPLRNVALPMDASFTVLAFRDGRPS